jgi:hypothetical protein
MVATSLQYRFQRPLYSLAQGGYRPISLKPVTTISRLFEPQIWHKTNSDAASLIEEHAMARSTPELEGVRRNMEQILSGKGGLEKVLEAASDGLAESISNEASTAMVVVSHLADACDATATDIQKTGEDIVQIANGIAAETAALAELLRKHGAAISNRIEEFTVMTTRISNVVRDVRADLNPSKSSGPPLAPGQ